MEHEDDQRTAELQADFVRRRRNQLLLLVPVFAAIFFLTALDEGQTAYGIPVNLLFGGAFVVIAASLIYSLFNWRCPSCSGYLGRSINPRFCARCGFRLR